MSSPVRGTWIEIESIPACQCALCVVPPCGGRGLKSDTVSHTPDNSEVVPARGTWIEIYSSPYQLTKIASRPPHGGRGLKFYENRKGKRNLTSSPVRGTWIEILRPLPLLRLLRHVVPVRGTWIEIETPEESRNPFCGRPPCGGRGFRSKKTRRFAFCNYSSIITQDCYQLLFFR